MFAVGAALGCAPNQPWNTMPEPARETPSFFVVDSSFAPLPAPGQKTCAVHMRDPGDGTRLTLRRSLKRGDPDEYLGDYTVGASGKYGIAKGELLRLACESGRPIGIVPEK